MCPGRNVSGQTSIAARQWVARGTLVEARGIFDGEQQHDPGEAHGGFHPAEVVGAHYEVVHNVLHAVRMRDIVPHNVLHLPHTLCNYSMPSHH